MAKVRFPDDRLRAALKKLGVRQVQAAFDLGISDSKFNRICLGWDKPDEEMRSRIADYLGVDVKSIWNEEVLT